MSLIVKKPESQNNMIDWWKKVVLENYANFSGRARRSEYWYFSLLNIIIAVPLIILFITFSESGGNSDIISTIFMFLLIAMVLLLLIPGLAVSVRRLHDTGKSGWWYLIGVIPIVSYVGNIVLLVFYCMDSEPGSNKWGPNPKMPHEDEIDQIGQNQL
ncbi:MAG: DUF805 domain-containing protein [Flavobacteriaceae bacterium]